MARRFTIYIKDYGRDRDHRPDFLGTVEADDLLGTLVKIEEILKGTNTDYEREDTDLAHLSFVHLPGGLKRVTSGNEELDIYVKVTEEESLE